MVDDPTTHEGNGATTEEDEFFSFFKEKEEEESEEKSEPNSEAPVFPEADHIPKEFQGLPMTPENVEKLARVTRDLQKEYTKSRQELAEITRRIESGGGGEATDFGDLPESAAAALTTSIEAVTDLRVELAISQDPHIAPYKEEVLKALKTVPPSQRANPATIQAAINLVKGAHVEEILSAGAAGKKEEMSVKETPPTNLGSSTAAPPVSGPDKGSKIASEVLADMPESQRRNLLAWADGDPNKLKKMLGG